MSHSSCHTSTPCPLCKVSLAILYRVVVETGSEKLVICPNSSRGVDLSCPSQSLLPVPSLRLLCFGNFYRLCLQRSPKLGVGVVTESEDGNAMQALSEGGTLFRIHTKSLSRANPSPASSHALGILTPKSQSSWNSSLVSNRTGTATVHFVCTRCCINVMTSTVAWARVGR